MENAFAPEMLDSVANMWYRKVENYPRNAGPGTRTVASRALRLLTQIPVTNYDAGKQDVLHRLPTLSMSLELKKVLPAEGVRSLSARAQARQIR